MSKQLSRKQRVGVAVEAVGEWLNTHINDAELDTLLRSLYAPKPNAVQTARVQIFYEAHKEALEHERD